MVIFFEINPPKVIENESNSDAQERMHNLVRKFDSILQTCGGVLVTDSVLGKPRFDPIKMACIIRESHPNLDDVRTLGTGYVITPYVCVLEKPFGKLTINDEVERIYSPKLYDLFQTRTTDTVHDIQGSVEFAIKDEIIWGASARILEQIRLRIESGFR